MTETSRAITRHNNVVTWACLLAVVWYVLTPVVIAMAPKAPLTYDAPYVSGEFTGYKVRSCPPVAGSERGFVEVDGVWFDDVPFKFVDDPSPGSSKPSRVWSNFGRWEWSHKERPDAVLMEIDHTCNGQVRTSSYGPYEVEK